MSVIEAEQATRPSAAAALVDRGVIRTLFGMAFPMLAGTLAMTTYHLADTWFVSRLGTLPLAAMGYTFPVIMLLTFVAGGIGSGVTTLVSHAIGRRDHADAAKVVSHGIAFALLVSAGMTVAGYFSIDFIFSQLGADADARPLVGAYMRTWYIGAVTMSLPMMGNGVLISAGDSQAASRFMILGTGLNLILDPIMIFGWLGCPAMGIRGAALATVIAQAASTIWLLHLLIRKHRLLVFRKWRLPEYLATIRRILAFGIPNILSMVLMPISGAVITRLLGRFGNEAVAGASAAGRVEMFAFVVPMALGISLTPFVSQNFGARRLDRIHRAMTASMTFALAYGAGVAVLFFLGAPWIAAVFTNDPRVAAVLNDYLRRVSFGYGMMEAHRYCTFFLTGLHKPGFAAALNALRVLVFLIPLSILGARYFGVNGVFMGRLATDLTVGGIGMIWISRVLGRMKGGRA